jgi:D-glycero-alpha-D-manno-heptose-7-phosphate kinase
MIISQTPFRVSFAGGGTDLPAYYRTGYGAVLSVALRRHMYVTVHRRFEQNIRVSYSKTEYADSVDGIQHDLVREAMRMTNTQGPLEITTIADAPAGTGVGSSSAVTVGLLNALHAYHGRGAASSLLAEQACAIEIERLGAPIGKQDQYAAAFGGINYLRFEPDESVKVESVPSSSATIAELENHGLLIFLGRQRCAGAILARQRAGTHAQRHVLSQMRDLAGAMRDHLVGAFDIEAFAALLDSGWRLKRSLGFGISDAETDASYRAAREAGAWGGKLLGAGGGGFLLVLAPPERHAAILRAVGAALWLPLEIDPRGSRIVFASDSEGDFWPVAPTQRASALSAERATC